MRQAIIEVAAARKGGGKTYVTAQEKISPYIITTPTWKGRPVLIYDCNTEYSDKHCRVGLKVKWTAKALALKDLSAWTMACIPEVRRILPLNAAGALTQDTDEMEEILNVILQTFRNGLLLIEDPNAYLIGISSKKIISAITRNRQKNLDLILHLQSLRAIPPRLLANMNIFRFHKCNESIRTIDAKLNNPELFYIAEALVKHKFKTDIRFYCYVDNEMDSIFGSFSKKDYWVACYLYLKENKPDILRLAFNRFGVSETAYKYCISELEKYYGNR